MEKEDRTTTIIELAKEIAGHLPGWELGDLDKGSYGGPSTIAFLIHAETGAEIGLKSTTNSHVVQPEDRIRAFPCWPPGPPNSGWRTYMPHNPTTKAITMASKRGPEAIAKDIARRMPLSTFLAEYLGEAERSEKDADKMRRNEEFIEDVARFWDTTPYPGGSRTRRYDRGSGKTLDMEIQWDRAKLTVEGEDLEMMDTLARLAAVSAEDLIDILVAAKVTLDNLHAGDFDLCQTLDLLDSMSRAEAGHLCVIIGEALK